MTANHNSDATWAISRLASLIMVVSPIWITSATGAATKGEPNAPPVEITVLYDNYKLDQDCRTDWGFSCLVTGFEKTILFDAGTLGDVLLANMDKLHVEAADVNAVVVSHDHLDHTGGLTAFLDRRAGIPAYLPKSVSPELIQNMKSRGADVTIPDGPMQICKHVHLTGPLGIKIIEQALVLDTSQGLIVITGCAHPGVVPMVRKAKETLGKDVYLVLGGFHLLDMSDAQVRDVIGQLKTLGVRKVGASHCTGPKAIDLFRQAYGEDLVPVGVGKIRLPADVNATRVQRD